VPGFTRAYHIHRLVYYEEYREARDALHREKQLKAWRREKKVALVERRNPDWSDLAAR
jgi:putative endonuclease